MMDKLEAIKTDLANAADRIEQAHAENVPPKQAKLLLSFALAHLEAAQARLKLVRARLENDL